MSERVGEVLLQQRVSFRGDDGRFLAEVDAACRASASQLADAVAHVASGAAWRSSGPVTAQAHGFSAVATAFGRTAQIQEFGARPHVIESREGARVLGGGKGGVLANEKTGFFSGDGIVHHPGVRARHFLSEAGRAVAQMGPALISRNFPK